MNRKLWLRVSNVFSFLLILFQLSTISEAFIKRQIETNAVCESEGCLATAEQLKTSIDPTVEPCDDFYQYACGNWPKNQCKADEVEALSKITLRIDQNNKTIIEFLGQKNDIDEPEALHKARKFYSMCLNPASYKGVDKVKNMLEELGSPILPLNSLQKEKTSASSESDHANLSNSTFDYIRAFAKVARIADIHMFFVVDIIFNLYNLNENLIVISKPDDYQGSSRLDIDIMEQMMKTLCEDDNLSHDEISCTFNLTKNHLANKVLSHYSDLGKSELPPMSPLPVLYTLEELQKISDDIADKVQPSIPKLNFTSYLEELFSGIENATLDLRNASKVQIVVVHENWVRFGIEFLYKFNIQELEFELWRQVVFKFLPYANWEIFEAMETDKNTSIEQRCVNMIIPEFALAISYMYLKEDHINHAKLEIEEMVDYMRKDMKTVLEEALWIDEETKEKALKKLALMKLHNTYPDSREFVRLLGEKYDDTIITDSMVDTVVGLIQNKIIKKLNKLNEPADLTSDWAMPPTEVNAVHNANTNSLVIPAAILDWPIYIQSLKALNYGSIGFIVGHEITHGFDTLGMKFNEFGVLQDWWKNDTFIKFIEHTQCFIDVYSGYETKFHGILQKGNSSLTLGEDIADNGGFKRALHAYRSYVCNNGEEPALINFENFTHEQLFTLGFATTWCEYPTEKSAALKKNEVHNPLPVRVNGVLKNSEEFAEIWNCPIGSKMNPDKKCSLW